MNAHPSTLTANLEKDRRRTHNASMQVRIPEEAKAILAAHAHAEGVTASTVVRWAILDYLKSHNLIEGQS